MDRRVIATIPTILLAATAFAVGQERGTSGPGDFFGVSGGAEEEVVGVAAQFTAPGPATPGRLFVTATLKPGWHIYSITQPRGGPVATRIALGPSQAYRLAGEFQPSPPPQKKVEPAFKNLVVESHYGTVTWHAPIELAAGTDPAALRIEGAVTVQPCDPNACLPPRSIPFAAALGPGVAVGEPAPADAVAAPQAASILPPDGTQQLPWQPFTSVSLIERLNSGFAPEETEAAIRRENAGASPAKILWAIGLGLLGGLILNVMPCVLPVIGLKILSFIEQAGHDRHKAFLLNVWYALGLLSVFAILAGLAATLGLGWGQLFSSRTFNVTLAAVVFAMGLSFLGVWEVPIPGFVGRGKMSELGQKEGAPGAFAKGVLTTVLATPCSAPFLAPALTWALAQPPVLIYAVFLAAGIGMASPYLLIGAFPEMIRFLPKPGAWMDTFKQIMGFVLLGTVVFIFTFLEIQYVVPTIGLLFGLWAACWWIGRVPPTADFGATLRAWLAAAALTGAVYIAMFPGTRQVASGRLAFRGLAQVMQARFAERIDREVACRLVEQFPGETGRNTVMVDFTADWCLTCKTLEATVLDTQAVRELVGKNGVIVLRADWTHADPEVSKMLEILGGKQVPVVAIFPADDPNRPIVLRGGYTQRTLLDALEKAGPSRRAS